jgi:hypothetical protein
MVVPSRPALNQLQQLSIEVLCLDNRDGLSGQLVLLLGQLEDRLGIFF